MTHISLEMIVQSDPAKPEGIHWVHIEFRPRLQAGGQESGDDSRALGLRKEYRFAVFDAELGILRCEGTVTHGRT